MSLRVNTNPDRKPIQRAPISLPHRFKSRPYQAEIYNTFLDMLEQKNNYREFLLEWHRRCGKDVTFFQLVVAAACKYIGDYAYMLPLNVQAKKVILNGNVRDSSGQPCKFLDFIPPSMLGSVNFSEGIIRLTNGSNIYVMGSDNYDANVGMNLSGVVFSEWSLCNPKSYDYFAPMLEETHRQEKGRGWCLKCWTPRGKNHAWKDRNNAQKEANKETHYFSSMKLGESTDNDGVPLYTMDDFNKWVSQGKDEDLLKQEWLLDYEVEVKGVIFGKQLRIAREEGRVRKVPIDPKIPVLTFWDIGMNDHTTIWFMQPSKTDDSLFLIHYYENNNEGMEHYVNYMTAFANKHSIEYGTVYFPHDGKNQEFIAGDRRHTAMSNYGFNVHVIDRTKSIDLAINQTRNIFKRFVFDEERCEVGLEHLEKYVYKVNQKFDTLGTPLHNASSNAADSLRQIGQYYADKYVASRHDEEAWSAIQEQMNIEDDVDDYWDSGDDYY